MTFLAYYALNISLVLSAFATVLYFSNNNKNIPLLSSTHRMMYAIFALISFAALGLLYALYSRDFQIEYVASYSNRSLSWFYTGAAFWAGQAGSLLLWAWLLAVFAVIVLLQNKNRNPQLLPYTMAVMSATIFFFNYLLVFKTSPFVKLPQTPPDGVGLNPLLQNPGMIFHPPSLYVGFVGFTVPFAFAFAALLAKRLDEQWIKSIRRWTLFSWLFLTIGNILGMQWAYVELGWGGYWAWDPVENSSLLPWLTGTAFLHSVIVQERKGMLKIWNIVLIALTFALTIFGTFVTRSGLISSVHAFGVSNLGPLFLGFLALILLSSGILLVQRTNLLQSRGSLGTWTSKEAGFMINNILFIAITLGVFLGTILPTISELFQGSKMTVGPIFFNRFSTPLGIAIFLLIGMCALLSWEKTTAKKLLRNFMIPVSVGLLSMILLLSFGVSRLLPLVALGIAFFAITTIVSDWVRGTLVRSRVNKLAFPKALVHLMTHNKRRYGGYIVHLGMLFFFIGIIGSSSFQTEKTATLKKNQALSVGPYTFTFQGIFEDRRPAMLVDAAVFNLEKNGRSIGTIHSEKHLFPNFQPATEVGIRSTLREDVYLILANYDKTNQVATVSVLINPLVLWIWIGGIVMVLGTIFAMAPNIFANKRTV